MLWSPSLGSQDNNYPTENIIPVVPRHNFGVFSRRSNSSNGLHRKHKPQKYDKYDKFDKISIAENDDKEFEQLVDETDAEHEIKVRDWHVMLEHPDVDPHDDSIDGNDARVGKHKRNHRKKR